MSDLPPDPLEEDELPADSAASLRDAVEEDEQRDIDQGEEKDRK